jgi:hypothetical protein
MIFTSLQGMQWLQTLGQQVMPIEIQPLAEEVAPLKLGTAFGFKNSGEISFRMQLKYHCASSLALEARVRKKRTKRAEFVLRD